MTTTDITYDINTQTIRNFNQLPGGTPKVQARRKPQRNNSRRQAPPQSDCRIIVSLINHHTGTPFGSVDAELDGLLPSERAILAVGLSGMRSSGEPIKRMAIYGYRDGHAQLRFPINFDHISGAPVFKDGGTPREAELAAINWMQGAMFNPELAAGVYDFNVRAISEEMPLRREFASERCTDASLEMFSTYLGLQSPANELSLPEVLPLLTPGQLPADTNPATLAVREFLMEPSGFIAHAVDRFVLGLRSAGGIGFKELKRAFIKQFEIADETILATKNDETHGIRTLMRVCADQTGLGCETELSQQHSILKFAQVYLQGQNLDTEAMKESGLVTYQAIRLLENYFLNRTEDGKVLMFAPKQDVAYDEELFRKPSTYSVCGAPLVIHNGFKSSGMFPFMAGDLLS